VDLQDTNSLVTVLSGLAIAAGIVGVIVPVLPGLLLCWAGVLGWAIFAEGGSVKWVVLALATLLAGGATVLKYAWPGRRLKRSGVPNLSLFAGGALALAGFFLIPIVGLVIGFVLGVLLAEYWRLGDWRSAWPSTRQALMAAGLSMLIELAAALCIAFAWVMGLLTV
jgi:uncharacterized protein YqgC (DUF456 family)